MGTPKKWSDKVVLRPVKWWKTELPIGSLWRVKPPKEMEPQSYFASLFTDMETGKQFSPIEYFSRDTLRNIKETPIWFQEGDIVMVFEIQDASIQYGSGEESGAIDVQIIIGERVGWFSSSDRGNWFAAFERVG